MDYIVADRIVLPEDQQQHFAEKIAYLPYTYQPNDRKRAIPERASTRKECGLPENGIVFCCFNNTHKFTPELFDVWMRLLERDAGERAVGAGDDSGGSAEPQTRSAQARRGAGADRLRARPEAGRPPGARAARGPVSGHAAAQRAHDGKRLAVVRRAGDHLPRHDVRRPRGRQPAERGCAWGFGDAIAR